ncbi:Outer membrane protein A precursor [Methylophaga frappieri]|uniref:Outer membrane protein A n=1 Tax=Methylophaga frappieri (strain ATCC BAA-2434 / DSM 25690 / JAM7) TaxID=754477 RepID=I1YIN1_METFJ|nr:OmpA family protein [Methylophaga frappieri]AFJ02774.1 Outer membrane protein A precursor [Methylophaga frappieri]
MNLFVKLAATVMTVSLLAACAGQDKRTADTYLLCSASGAIVGGAGVGAVSGGAGAVGGAVAGSQLALLLCGPDEMPAEPEPVEEPVVCEMTAPAGALTDQNGCAFDSDNDGVVDGIDMCPATPEGVQVDSEGCPLDSDGDGVADYRDLCPGTPAGVKVDRDGCPVSGANILSLTGVNFAFDKAVLTPEAEMILDDAVAQIKDTDDVLEVRVEGHTDSVGPEAYNLNLSQRRAEAVVDYLVANGVNGSQLVPVGMGEGQPVADNSTSQGRAENRRVDFVVVE